MLAANIQGSVKSTPFFFKYSYATNLSICRTFVREQGANSDTPAVTSGHSLPVGPRFLPKFIRGKLPSRHTVGVVGFPSVQQTGTQIPSKLSTRPLDIAPDIRGLSVGETVSR